ncbi:MAG: Lipid II flippase MurJ [Chlamydiales bacterium]|nr:Lipid II flippase MurJ [Chlamydiales bacterium]MCH9636326.1 Lipid II flippase MurJ [Chlamydiales bacterium]
MSRITGLGREVGMAALFGTLPAVAAFWMAFRFSSLLRRLFGEGALHSAFIPHYEHLKGKDPAKASRFFYDLTVGLALFLAAIVLIAEGFLGYSLLHGAGDVVKLTMLMLPAILFICLFALNSALLNCERSYFLPSVAPAFLNLIWIAGLFFVIRYDSALAMERLAMVVVGAFAFQWLLTLPRVTKLIASASPTGFSFRSLFAILKPFLLGMLGVAAVQINSACDALFARAADPEGPAFLWYALRLQQLPLALFGVALASALFPPISRAIEKRDYSKYFDFLNFAVNRAISWMLPITFAILSLGLASVNLVYGHGQFSESATYTTTLCLLAYGLALVPMTLTMLFASAFYAIKNYKTPAIFSCISVALNIGLNALFVYGFGFGAISVALATAISSAANALLLVWILNVTQKIEWKGVSENTAKLVICSLIASFVTLFMAKFLPHLPRELWKQLEVLAIEAPLFAITFLAGAKILNVSMYGEIGIRKLLQR